jgi:hypothetical protein
VQDSRFQLNDLARIQDYSDPRVFGYPQRLGDDGIGMQTRILEDNLMNRYRDGRNLNLIRDVLDVRSDIQPADIIMARLSQGVSVPNEILVPMLAQERKWNRVSDDVIRRATYDIAMNRNNNDMALALLDTCINCLPRNRRDVGNLLMDQTIGNRQIFFRNPDIARNLTMYPPIDPMIGMNELARDYNPSRVAMNSFPGQYAMNPLAQVVSRNNFGDQCNNIRGFSASAFPLSSLALNDFTRDFGGRQGSLMNPAGVYQPMGMAF